eukprot:1859960-Prymnesium_polylepis.1
MDLPWCVPAAKPDANRRHAKRDVAHDGDDRQSADAQRAVSLQHLLTLHPSTSPTSVPHACLLCTTGALHSSPEATSSLQWS